MADLADAASLEVDLIRPGDSVVFGSGDGRQAQGKVVAVVRSEEGERAVILPCSGGFSISLSIHELLPPGPCDKGSSGPDG